MEEKPKSRQFATNVGALLLWLIAFVLGLNAIYILLQIFYLVFGAVGGGLSRAERYAPALVFLLTLGFLIFTIITSEYHRKRVGRPESWRLFAWTIGIETGLSILYYLI